MAEYDSNIYGICISTAKTGSGTTAYPDGDKWFIVSAKIGGNTTFMQKIKELAGGGSYSTKDGKMGSTVKLSDCPLVAGATTFNALIPFIKKKHRAAQGVLYFWIKTLSSGTPNWAAYANTLYIGMTAAGSETNYMSGYLTAFDWEIDGGMYWIKSANFKECL
jgi:hypothetical protein